jgi:hypothetical protein
VDHEYLKGMLSNGFKRFYLEGAQFWSRKDLHAAINPLGHANEIDTPKVQTVLKELENEGLIKLLKRDDQYLEVLHD